MLVGDRMTRNPVTATEDTGIDEALHLMRERKVRRLPVLDQAGRMVGIVSDKDLLHAAPSPATSLSVSAALLACQAHAQEGDVQPGYHGQPRHAAGRGRPRYGG